MASIPAYTFVQSQPRKVLMPPPVKGQYSNDEVEAEVARRIAARDQALRDQGIDKQLESLRREIEQTRKGRLEEVTKSDLKVGLEDLRVWISGNFVNKTDGFNVKERQTLQTLAQDRERLREEQAHRHAWHETVWGRLGILAGIVVAVMQIIGFTVTILHK